MKPKVLWTMVVMAAAAAAAAFVTVSSRSHTTSETPAAGRAKLFPGLEERINDIATIEIRKGKNTAVIEKSGDAATPGWALSSKAGFPVPIEKFRPLVLAIARAEVLGEKTSNPELYKRLSVQDLPATPPATPPAPDAAPGVPDEGKEPALVTLSDASGKALASMIVGKNESAATASDQAGTFVRRAGEKQAFVVTQMPILDAGHASWIDSNVSQIRQERVKWVSITHPGPTPDVVEIARKPDAPAPTPAAPDAPKPPPPQPEFFLSNLPAGREIKGPGNLTAITGALGYLTFEDVTTRATVFGESVEGAQDQSDVLYKTAEGVNIRIKLRSKDGKTWAALTAEHEPPPDNGPVPEGVTKEVADLNAKWSRWAYAVPSYTAQQLTMKLEGVLKEAPAPPGPQGPTPAAPTEANPPPSPAPAPTPAPTPGPG